MFSICMYGFVYLLYSIDNMLFWIDSICSTLVKKKFQTTRFLHLTARLICIQVSVKINVFPCEQPDRMKNRIFTYGRVCRPQVKIILVKKKEVHAHPLPRHPGSFAGGGESNAHRSSGETEGESWERMRDPPKLNLQPALELTTALVDASIGHCFRRCLSSPPLLR